MYNNESDEDLRMPRAPIEILRSWSYDIVVLSRAKEAYDVVVVQLLLVSIFFQNPIVNLTT